MQVGLMARTLPGPTLEPILDSLTAYGIPAVQFNLSCAGLPDMPDRIEDAECDRIRSAMANRSIAMSAISGTFNMIHPDVAVRHEGLRRLEILAGACGRLGTSIVSLCTGTRDAANMWRRHPENDSPEAWSDLLETMGAAVRIAEAAGVTLGVEPEVSNVVDSARKARRLLDEIGSPHLGIIIDGANLFHAGELPRMAEILDEAFDLLGDDIVLAHAKDLTRDGEAGNAAAGTGLLDYPRYAASLRRTGYAGPLILHGLSVEQIPGCIAFLRSVLATPEA